MFIRRAGCKFRAKKGRKELVFEGTGISFFYMGCPDTEGVVAIRRASLPLAIDREVCPEEECLMACMNWEVEAPILLLYDKHVRALGLGVGRVVGEVRDLPAPPVPYEDLETGELGWTRFVPDLVLEEMFSRKEAEKICRYPEHCQLALVGEGGLVKSIGDIPTSYAHSADCTYEGFSLLAARYEPDCFVKVEEDLYDLKCKYSEWDDPRFPGLGRLLGEEFRIREVEGDYLRLVGRGGDERVAWDFVYGVLDSGEWVLMGEDGLYLAERKDDRVVVVAPYGGPVERVRGPPYGLLYPVVVGGAVRWPAWAPRVEVDPQLLLRWPLAQPKWDEGGLEFYGVYGLGLVGRGVRVREVEAEWISLREIAAKSG